MKKVLIDLAYKRVPDEKLDLEVLDKYGSRAVHELVNVVYNGIHGPQKDHREKKRHGCGRILSLLCCMARRHQI